MADWSRTIVRGLYEGNADFEFSVEEAGRALLLRLGDHVTDNVDEDGDFIDPNKKGPYYFDLVRIADDLKIKTKREFLNRAATFLAEQKWVSQRKNSPLKVAVTDDGFDEAQRINDAVYNNEPPSSPLGPYDWSLGFDKPFDDWLLVHAFAFPKANDQGGMINLRAIADNYLRPIPDEELRSIMGDLEDNDYVMNDTGPTAGDFWIHFNTAGAERATLLVQLWNATKAIPASNRFVQLNDNSPSYSEAIARLTELIQQVHEIRINDWPEKEGMIAALRGALDSIRTRYVNKTTILAAVSSVTTFIIIKFAEAPISDIANATWTAVKTLF